MKKIWQTSFSLKVHWISCIEYWTSPAKHLKFHSFFIQPFPCYACIGSAYPASDRGRTCRRQETTIDTMKFSIRIQSPKWHGKVRTNATSTSLIPVQQFSPIRGTFLLFFVFSSFSCCPADESPRLEENPSPILVRLAHSDESARSNSPFCLARNSPTPFR